MRLRHRLETVVAGLLGVMASPAFAIRAVAPVAPDAGGGQRCQSPLALEPSYRIVSALQPMPAPVPTFRAPAPIAMPTRPEPPVVRENPPVLPTRHDDDQPKDEDPMWMYKAMNNITKEQRGWSPPVAVPPPPPPPLAVPPLAVLPGQTDTSERPRSPRWLVMAAALVALGAFAFGRASRRR